MPDDKTVVAARVIAQTFDHVGGLDVLSVGHLPSHRLELLNALVTLRVPALVVDAPR